MDQGGESWLLILNCAVGAGDCRQNSASGVPIGVANLVGILVREAPIIRPVTQLAECLALTQDCRRFDPDPAYHFQNLQEVSRGLDGGTGCDLRRIDATWCIGARPYKGGCRAGRQLRNEMWRKPCVKSRTTLRTTMQRPIKTEVPCNNGDDNGQCEPVRDWSVYVFVGGCAVCAVKQKQEATGAAPRGPSIGQLQG
jgi:hypothetical protein